ncbi:GNAT family N-acetyltransferase [Dokdonella soli]
MIATPEISLAVRADAPRIAAMSRDLVEQGLGWRWTPSRILRVMRDRATNVAVAREGEGISGFGIMQYKDDEAHLLLLAVDPMRRRKGIGSALMAWLETTALTAGTGCIYLEARARNAEARAFYGRLGYIEILTVRGLYSNSEDGIRIAKDLWSKPPSGG